jgi:esterase/lipase
VNGARRKTSDPIEIRRGDAIKSHGSDADRVRFLAGLHPAPELASELDQIRCPVLLCTSPQDHVVPPSNSDFLAEHVTGPVERVTLERSYHVATLDHDKDEIESRAVDFARKVTEV